MGHADYLFPKKNRQTDNLDENTQYSLLTLKHEEYPLNYIQKFSRASNNRIHHCQSEIFSNVCTQLYIYKYSAKLWTLRKYDSCNVMFSNFE
jgi:hypothetical protein